MKDIDYIILRKIVNNDIRISQKHKDIVHRLSFKGYIEYVNGDWVVTKEGIVKDGKWGVGNTEE